MSIRKLHVLVLSAILLLTPTITAFATDEYAMQTGEECEYCHVNPSGGGELTSAGEGYALALMDEAPLEEPTLSPKSQFSFSYLIRLVAGYLHFLFAFFWFGTILYVHLVLKPAYASGGLPRGEVKVGLLSMLIMAVTGAILFAYRVPSAEFLVTTRFGILLLIKIVLFLIMVCSALFVVLYIGPRLRRKKELSPSDDSGDLTPEQLANFDGKEGRPAYIAFKGEIYDVTKSNLWQRGSHLNRHAAGMDLTDAIGNAPHGENKVLNMPHIGKLIEESGPGLTIQQKVFYFMAYMNLSFVLIIILILAFWKWL